LILNDLNRLPTPWIESLVVGDPIVQRSVYPIPRADRLIGGNSENVR